MAAVPLQSTPMPRLIPPLLLANRMAAICHSSTSCIMLHKDGRQLGTLKGGCLPFLSGSVEPESSSPCGPAGSPSKLVAWQLGISQPLLTGSISCSFRGWPSTPAKGTAEYSKSFNALGNYLACGFDQCKALQEVSLLHGM